MDVVKALGSCQSTTDLLTRWDSMAARLFAQADQHKQSGRRKRHHETLSRARAFQQAADELYNFTDAHLTPLAR